MSHQHAPNARLAGHRARLRWSQAELARRAGVPRTSINAIEKARMSPSVATALRVARALGRSVEDLFGEGDRAVPPAGPRWAWAPHGAACRYWEAEVGGAPLRYPVEALGLNALPHDGVWRDGARCAAAGHDPGATLVLACCDPAAGLLAASFARASGFRMLVFPRSGEAALDLLQQGCAHVAGLHRATAAHPERNAETVRARLGEGYLLVRAARWEEGLALPAASRARSPSRAARCVRAWALREPGSAARECLDELRADARGRTVHSHAAVAEAVRGGWAGAGVCVRIAAEDAGLTFLPVRTEAMDFCFAAALEGDPRMQALLRHLRSPSHRQWVAELPGYDARETGELVMA